MSDKLNKIDKVSKHLRSIFWKIKGGGGEIKCWEGIGEIQPAKW